MSGNSTSMALRFRGLSVLPEYSEKGAAKFFSKLKQLLEKECCYVGPDFEMLPEYPFDNTKNESIVHLRISNQPVSRSGTDADFIDVLAAAPQINYKEEAGYNRAGGAQFIIYLEGVY